MALDANILLFILATGTCVAVALGLHTEWRISRFTRGKSGRSLEDMVVKNTADVEKFKVFRKELDEYLESVEMRLDQSIRGVGTVRFNPFKGTGDGGHMSFATAFLDEDENGVVISTLSTRERMSIFAKPLKEGESEYELTQEERNAIGEARERLRA